MDRMDDMLVDLAVAAPSLGNEEPTEYAQAFYRMIDSAEQLVYGKTTHSTLSTTARLLSIKSQHNLSIACYDDIVAPFFRVSLFYIEKGSTYTFFSINEIIIVVKKRICLVNNWLF